MPSIAVLHDPLTPQEHLQLGLSYEKKGLIEDAIKHYEEASKEDAKGFSFLGNLYLNQIIMIKLKNITKSNQKNDKLADAYNNLAWVYCLQRKNLDEAEELVKKAIEIEKNNADKVKIYEDTIEKIQKLKVQYE